MPTANPGAPLPNKVRVVNRFEISTAREARGGIADKNNMTRSKGLEVVTNSVEAVVTPDKNQLPPNLARRITRDIEISISQRAFRRGIPQRDAVTSDIF